MSADISRKFADPRKRFRSVTRQQGRLPTDAEENHAAEIAGWTHDTEFSETITPLGTPDDGFKIVIPAGVHDSFQILGGSYYLGGARIENPAEIAYAAQQGDNWLTQNAPVAANSRILVWMECEERIVTAVQDNELLEPALRGPDGAARTRMCWRVRQDATAAATCWAALTGVLGPMIAGELDTDTGAITSSGTLTIGFDNTDPDLDLCKPALGGGYLGNRNNTYRIKRTGAGRFIWGEDNASQLFRVTVDANGTTIRFLTEPRDEYLRPKAGQTVELLRGDVLLPNFEKVAEPDGLLFRVTGGYSAGAITVAPAVDPAWLAWLPATPVDPAADPAIPRHFYLRVWTGGGEGGQPDVPFVAGTPKTLSGTGLTVQFDGVTLMGDSWTCAARPDAPMRVLPWALQTGMTAHASRRHAVPLAIVDLATGIVSDCRSRFRPLYKIRGCCTITVGPTGSRQGDTDSIVTGLTLLPPEGGTLCLLAGVHLANVSLTGRHDIRFSGCAGLTRWLPLDAAQPLATLLDTQTIGFHDIIFEAGEEPAIVAYKSNPLDDAIENGGLLIEDCVLIARSGCAIVGRFLQTARVLGCRIEAGPLPVSVAGAPVLSGLPAVFLQGERLEVGYCEILAPLSARNAPAQRALGGVQIGGGSRLVHIHDSIIRDGAGIGVTLGSIIVVTIPRAALAAGPVAALAQAHFATLENPNRANPWQPLVFTFFVDAAGCIHVGPVPPDPAGDGNVDVPISEGPVEDVVIERNLIRAMGNCGIATFPLGPVMADGSPALDAIAVVRLIVADNAILDCMRLEAATMNNLLRLYQPYGGIALGVALDCLFRGNEIAGNGTTFPDATVGIGLVYGEDIRIEDNRIECNGVYSRQQVIFGPNAGVHAGLVIGGLAGFAEEEVRKSDRPALAIHGNVISVPAGRALRALAIGPVMVNDNRLTGGNPSRLFIGLTAAVEELTALLPNLKSNAALASALVLDLIIDMAGGDAVNLVNLGVAEDLLLILLKRRKGRYDTDNLLFVAFMVNFVAQQRLLVQFQRGGETMFANNQVSLRRPEPDGPAGTASSIFIASLDDIGFTDNQYEVEGNRLFAVINAILLGVTVRSTSNRGQEGAFCLQSIFSFGLVFNTSSLNQTTTPITALSLNPPIPQFAQLNQSAF